MKTHLKIANISHQEFLPIALLYALTIAVILFVISIAFFYCNSVIEQYTSIYRRQMNAAAYEAQIFFDQREQLLRSSAATAVRNIFNTAAVDTPKYLGETQQIHVFPLTEKDEQFDWALVFTPNGLREINRMKAELVYSSIISGETRSIFSATGQQQLPLTEEAQDWIHNLLSNKSKHSNNNTEAPIVWLMPPIGEEKWLIMYTPIDTSEPSSGWIGLAFTDINSAIDFSSIQEGSYILANPNKQAAVIDPDTTNTDFYLKDDIDKFDKSGSFLSEYLVLSKSIGNGGWRLHYLMPFKKLLYEIFPGLIFVFILVIAIIFVIIRGTIYINRRIVAPANAHITKLAETVALNDALLKSSPVGFALVRTKDRKVLLSNKLADAWIAENHKKILHNQFAESVIENIKLSDGRELQVRFTAMPHQTQDTVLCTLTDVTEIKSVELSLRESKDAAEKANQAKSIFLATMSHEIRTPLYGIMGTLELLSLTSTTNQQKQYLKALNNSSNSLLTTLNNTLDLARIESGEYTLNISSFSPLELVENVISSFYVRAQSKNLLLYAAPAPNIPIQLLGDVSRIRQILDNLVNNAIKFTEFGYINLLLESKPLTSGEFLLTFKVIDTGTGISEEDLPSLFTPYYRSRTHSKIQGTGLGLSICANLAAVMQGKLDASSELGLGTCMTLTLTLPADRSRHITPEPQLKTSTVFVRGAVPDIVTNTCNWLRRWGAVAIPFRNASYHDKSAILIDTWPWLTPNPEWQGKHVIAQPPHTTQSDTNSNKTSLASAHSILSIGHSVQKLQNGNWIKQAHTELIETPLNKRVLVVEDNPVTRLILTEQLKKIGCTVDAEWNGREALNRPDALEFDAILTDLQMPILNGFVLSKTLRGRGYSAPIIGLTSFILTEDLERSKITGINKILLKPLSIPQLKQALNTLLISENCHGI